MNGGVEALSVSVQQKANKRLDLVNIYVPPKARDNDIRWIPVKDTTIIAGDLNGYHQLWDRAQPPDQMGEKLVDFIVDHNLVCCNDGSATRINRGTGGMSSSS